MKLLLDIWVRFPGAIVALQRRDHRTEQPVQEPEGALDSLLLVVSTFCEGPQEHEIQSEGVGSVLLDDGVRDDDIPLALGHLGPLTNDEAVLPELGKGLFEVQVTHILQGHGNEPGVEEVEHGVLFAPDIAVHR